MLQDKVEPPILGTDGSVPSLPRSETYLVDYIKCNVLVWWS